MEIGKSLKKLREDKGLTQQQMATLIHAHRSGYSKMENGQQDVPIDSLVRIANHFSIPVDDIIYYSERQDIPSEVSMEDMETLEQLRLIKELEKDERTILLKLIETFVTKKRFKEYVQENITSL